MNKEKLYRATCKNHRMIESSINAIKKNIKSNINLENEEEIIIYTRIFSFLVTCWIETRILKIIYEINAFDENEIHIILKDSTLCEKWIRTLNMSICKMEHIDYIDDCQVIASRLKFTDKVKYELLIKLINNQLQPEIEKRNRIAHGQWIIAFNSVLSDFSSDITKELNKDNYILLIQKLDIFKEIAFMINNLVASTLKKQFKNNFDEYYMKLDKLINKYELTCDSKSDEYKKFRAKMVNKYKIGQVKKELNKKRN